MTLTDFLETPRPLKASLAFRIAVPLVVFLAASLPYISTLSYPFQWDDVSRILKGGAIKDLGRLPLLWNRDYGLYFEEFQYRPLVTLTLFANYSWCGLGVWGWRVANIGLHGVNALLVSYLVTRIISDRWAGLIAGLFFAVHPLHTEVVNVVMYRTELMSSCFTLLSFLYYLRAWEPEHRSRFQFSLSWLFFLMALGCKPMSATLPVLLGLHTLIFVDRPLWRERFRSLIPYFILGGVWFVAVMPHFRPILRIGSAEDLSYGTPFFSRLHLRTLVHMSVPLLRYVGAFLLVAAPTLIYPTRIPAFKQMWGTEILGWLLLSVIVWWSLRIRRRWPVVSFSCLFVFMSLLPVSQIIPFNLLYADRYAFIPSIGYCLLLAGVFSALFKKQKIRFDAALVMAGLLGFSLYLTARRNEDWKDPLTLYKGEALANPQEMYTHLALAGVLMERNQFAGALEQAQAAKGAFPGSFKPSFYEGLIRLRSGNPRGAAQVFESLERSFPERLERYVSFWEELGFACTQLFQLDRAMRCNIKALRLNPHRPRAYCQLGLAFTGLNKTGMGLGLMRTAAWIDPDWSEPHRLLYLLHKSRNEIPESLHEKLIEKGLDGKEAL